MIMESISTAFEEINVYRYSCSYDRIDYENAMIFI